MEQVEDRAVIEVCLNCPRKTCPSGDCARFRAARIGKRPEDVRRGREYQANGQWKTLSEWAALCGMPASTLRTRLKKGWRLERAMSEPVKPNGQDTFEAFGEAHTLREWAQIRGISQNALSSRIYALEWPIEKALTEPVRVARKFTVWGETKTAKDWAKALGVTASLVNRRLRQGWDMERIAAHYGGRK